MRLTSQAVGKLELPQGRSEAIHFDDAFPGFGIRLRAGGSANWVFQYTIGDRQRRMTLGSAKVVDAATARANAAKLHARVKLGEDPAGTKAADRARANETFGACLKPYLARYRNRVSPRTYSDDERYLVKGFAPLHGLRIDKIERRDIAVELARLTEAAPIAANRARSALSRFLSWCLSEGLCETNAAAFTNKNEEKTRARVISDDELRSIWRALRREGDYGDIVKLLILTGQRATEIADLRWDEIDLGPQAAILLPPGRTKNKRPHIVPLSAPARAILEVQRPNGRELVFGTGKGGFSCWSFSKRRLDEAVKIKPWVIHDLRRTCATGMAKLGAQPHIIEAVLNHVSGHKAGVAGIYNRSTYEAEKRTALDRWAEHVAAIVEGRESNVTPLKRA
jgi:integrase